MPSITEATGVYQSDLAIRHAILQGIKDLRANTWLLDYICAGIRQDSLTKDQYGQKEIDALKSWFLKTEVPVVIYGRLGDVEAPQITINLVSSDEEANTLGDLHYVTSEDVPDGAWPDLTAPFTPIFALSTGLITVPVSVTVDIFPGMVIMDAQGQPHEILGVESPRTFKIAAGTSFDFSQATIRSGSPSTLQTLESAAFKEQYLIGVHVNGEPQQLVFLHSIISFLLLWGRESLLEARGFEKSTFSSTDFAKNQAYEVENVWTRYITITGTVRQCWPKRRFAKIQGISSRIRPIGSRNLPPDSRPTGDQSWIGDLDDIDSLGGS